MINGFGEAAEIKKLREELAAAHGVRVAFSAADLSKPTDATSLIEDATRELGAAGGRWLARTMMFGERRETVIQNAPNSFPSAMTTVSAINGPTSPTIMISR